ncbi:MAG: AMP-binding protein [bacterium]|nr:AMP-binding protein [bacterium]
MAEKTYAWEPNEYFLNESRIARFMQKYGISSWQELIERSNDIDWFWPRALDFLGIQWFTPYAELYDNSQGISHTKWFIGGKLNIYENCIERNIKRGLGDKTCIFYEHESGKESKATFSEFKEFIDAIASSMKANGIKKGDFVGMCMPISIESAAVMFACFKIGAVCIQMAPTITQAGVEDIISHIQITKAKMLFMVDEYIYKGKEYALNDIYYGLRDMLCLEHVVVLGNTVSSQHFSSFLIEEYGKGEREVLWEDFLKKGIGKKVRTERCSAEDLALMLFSSGTTDTPKRILHTHGGVLAQVCKEVGFAFDCKEDDVFYWMTNFGWMMAPWEIIGALYFGASLVFFEGVPMHPKADRVFEIIQKYRVTILGSTPGHITGFRDANVTGEGYDLSSLRILGSTGDTLHPENWIWYFEIFGKCKCPIINIIGGTELIGCIFSPLGIMILYPGTVGSFALGMGAEVVDDYGNPIRNRMGQVVCTVPFPSMTRSFFEDEKGFQDTYKFNPYWNHSDFAIADDNGFVYMMGRSDDVVPKDGHKFSPAKIEGALVSYGGADFRVMEAAAIGVSNAILCFVVVQGKNMLSEADVYALKTLVAKIVHPVAKPDRIYPVKALPRNAAAKVPHKDIRKAFSGEDMSNVKLLNPESLKAIQEYGKEFFSADNI